MESHRISIGNLQQFLLNMYEACKMNIVYIMEELIQLKNEVNEQRNFVNSKCMEILKEWERHDAEKALKFREDTQRLTVDHELELSDMKAALNEKDDVISMVKSEKESIKLEQQKEMQRVENEHRSTKELLEKTRDEIATFEQKLEDVEVLKQKEIKDLQEKMHMEYKAEIESLRSR